ncbi:hypothetical protein K435DRAFT_68791 [Dendrothele bispora CBS 962.96]|uniref:Uncharacterized protein n=1 Tax=Dendrothele bispora (strain CBS 962.96) TaxID=1314807 RepID=A0A4S8M542_DENBC|nr:hypothetical protein K435DRAFT_68791 [Dendrothele bispora CBS 962.96]
MSRSFFPRASHFSIHGHTVNFIGGDHNTNFHHVPVEDSGSVVSLGQGPHNEQSMFDEYQIIRRGNLRLLREISKETMDESKSYLQQRQLQTSSECLTFTRAAYCTKVIGESLPGSVAVIYGGKDAQAAWERDFLLFSKNHNPNMAHLFGLSKTSPGLVFYGDLIPVRPLWENGSAIIQCYITHRLKQDIEPLWRYGAILDTEVTPWDVS